MKTAIAMKSGAARVRKIAINVGQAAMTGLLMSGPAFAQLAAVQTKASAIQATIMGVGATVASIAVSWGGYKMMFQQAKWAEISHIVMGGALVGGAVALGAWATS